MKTVSELIDLVSVQVKEYMDRNKYAIPNHIQENEMGDQNTCMMGKSIFLCDQGLR